ncbi:hypothetical protein PVK64_08435 [Aliivibrio sp. S4TY2]|uniref:hypothetical protein n=1 Tax=unclassified Aliivibrio TaxID=2645654 RepID=UPI002378BFED|nr:MULTISPECIES: hypothetical protein [unclassified Aliivibrio]MDD9156211.1 hypothetical protein [Aliivibrio sp. S4TY2]MDD9160558.1 hypothetical protein [Aliivibrio sp. S4TY1]MDD9163919.1 hypothetical protein [Aliivibrio sp. S4MY2]MDD9168106.1 hypothetical protein [Aliivibrio sp. S4MY4]MDD9185115.1 hypothetical protein [Aliivibrio sp. S4MY3]
MVANPSVKVSSMGNTISVSDNQVSLSSEGKALLYALQDIEKESQLNRDLNKDMGDDVESFAHGALGMDHPDKIEEENDSSYSAGQYLSAALTVGGVLLALV